MQLPKLPPGGRGRRRIDRGTVPLVKFFVRTIPLFSFSLRKNKNKNKIIK
jgi:hypothetical protein